MADYEQKRANGIEKLQRLIDDGLKSGPTEPFDLTDFLRMMHEKYESDTGETVKSAFSPAPHS